MKFVINLSLTSHRVSVGFWDTQWCVNNHHNKFLQNYFPYDYLLYITSGSPRNLQHLKVCCTYRKLLSCRSTKTLYRVIEKSRKSKSYQVKIYFITAALWGNLWTKSFYHVCGTRLHRRHSSSIPPAWVSGFFTPFL